MLTPEQLKVAKAWEREETGMRKAVVQNSKRALKSRPGAAGLTTPRIFPFESGEKGLK